MVSAGLCVTLPMRILRRFPKTLHPVRAVSRPSAPSRDPGERGMRASTRPPRQAQRAGETGGDTCPEPQVRGTACAHSVVTKYQKRISGPMLDRKVPQVRGGKVPRVDYEKLGNDCLGESSASIREQVKEARERQHVRFEGTDIVCPVQESGLSSRAGIGTIAIRTCAWRKCASFVN